MAVADLKMGYYLVSDADLYLSKAHYLSKLRRDSVGADFQSVRKLRLCETTRITSERVP